MGLCFLLEKNKSKVIYYYIMCLFRCWIGIRNLCLKFHSSYTSPMLTSWFFFSVPHFVWAQVDEWILETLYYYCVFLCKICTLHRLVICVCWDIEQMHRGWQLVWQCHNDIRILRDAVGRGLVFSLLLLCHSIYCLHFFTMYCII